MTWKPEATVTVNGTSYTSNSLGGVTISYGRNTIWEQARAGYAKVQILNLNNTDFGFAPNQSLVITAKKSNGTAITLFTGIITSISNSMSRAGDVGDVAIQELTAVSTFAQMARKIVGTSSYAKEFDDVRITNILTEAGVTIGTVDTPGVYEFQSRTANPTDAYTLASQYAQQAFGYLYEETNGKVSYANESHRFVQARDYGYLNIPKSYILWNGVRSEKSLTEMLNKLILTYRAGDVTSQDTTSQATYGIVGGTISTELHNLTDAQIQADRYIVLRSNPRTNIGQFSIPLDSDTVSSANLDSLLGIYMGMPLQIDNLPLAIKNTTYRGFVEGWVLSLNRTQANLTISTTDYTLSVTPTRWQDVQPTLTWAGVGSTIQWTTYDDQENEWQLARTMAGLNQITLLM